MPPTVTNRRAMGTTISPPKRIKPQLTRLVDEAPSGNEWCHEVKYDGYVRARIDGPRLGCGFAFPDVPGSLVWRDQMQGPFSRESAHAVHRGAPDASHAPVAARSGVVG
jgi:hypothetical protein